MPLKVGEMLRQRYRIEETLGQGGMGAVYRATDVNLGVQVAVKENLFTTEEYARQFRREATILASLRHSALPRVTDHFVIEGEGQYLVMDFIEGEDLRERLERDGPVQEDMAIRWFVEVATCWPICIRGHLPSSTATSNQETSRSHPTITPCWLTSVWPRCLRKVEAQRPEPRR